MRKRNQNGHDSSKEIPGNQMNLVHFAAVLAPRFGDAKRR
jgi:hypothetical protein